MDVDAVLQSVQERDKWRRRLELLSTTLREVRERKRRVAVRLRRIQTELRNLREYSDALLDTARAPLAHARTNAERNPTILSR